MSDINWKALKNIDILTVDPLKLINIQDIKTNFSLPKNEKIIDFIKQVKNPYCYKCGETIIKNTYPETKSKFTDNFKQLIVDFKRKIE